MKLIALLTLSLLLLSCTQTPEVPSSKEAVVEETILDNKTEAQEAQEAYVKLQKQRANE